MRLDTFTEICTIGTVNEIKKFEDMLLTNDDSIDFAKIIEPPDEIKKITDESPKEDLEILNKWRVENWGTCSKGIIESISKIFFRDMACLSVSIKTVISEPIHIIDRLINENKNLFYFIHHLNWSDYEYIAFSPSGQRDVRTLCEKYYSDHDPETKTEFNKDNILLLKNSNMGYLHRRFLFDLDLGTEMISFLQNIKE